MSAKELYELWRDPPSLHWDEIVAPMNPTPTGLLDETPHFVTRWLRVAAGVAARIAAFHCPGCRCFERNRAIRP